MNFLEIMGHSAIKKRLVGGVREGRIAHAQLFCGGLESRALGMAVAYGRYVLCENRATSEGPCGECATCHRTSTFEHPDLHMIFPVNKSKQSRGSGDQKPISDHFMHLWREFYGEHRGVFSENEWYDALGLENLQGNINKEEANELLRKMSFKSFEGGWKVVVVYLPERMNDQAANTLLKLVEEPPPQTLFLFACETLDGVISTILSRVQITSLPPLESVGFAVGGGRGEEFFELFSALMRLGYGGKYLELMEWAEGAAGLGREGQRLWVDYSVAFLRECYVIGLGAGNLSTLGEGPKRVFAERFAAFVNHLTIEPLVREFELVAAQLRQNGAPRIVFTHFSMMVSKILVGAKRSIAAGE